MLTTYMEQKAKEPTVTGLGDMLVPFRTAHRHEQFVVLHGSRV